MPRGKPFEPGNPGKPRGAKNRLPRGFKASVRTILEELSLEERDHWKEVVRRIMRRPSFSVFPWYQLALHVLDGKPVEQIKLTKPQDIKIIMPCPTGAHTFPEEDLEALPPGGEEEITLPPVIHTSRGDR